MQRRNRMTVKELVSLPDFSEIQLTSPDREITGAYAGDLLSWVMSRAQSDCAWLTIMSNVNVLAVATLADVSCVIFTEGVVPDAEIISVAKEKDVNLVSTKLPIYEACLMLGGALK